MVRFKALQEPSPAPFPVLDSTRRVPSIDGNLTVNTNALFVNATDKKVGIGKTPTANLDILGNIHSSTGITSAAGGITATTGLFTGDGGALSNLQVSSFTGDVTLGTDTSGDYVASLVGGDGITVITVVQLRVCYTNNRC